MTEHTKEPWNVKARVERYAKALSTPAPPETIWTTPINDLGGMYSAKLQQPDKDSIAYIRKSTSDKRIAELEAGIFGFQHAVEIGLVNVKPQDMEAFQIIYARALDALKADRGMGDGQES